MHQENRYKQMVIYVEACESGSMFDTLLSPDINGETPDQPLIFKINPSDLNNNVCTCIDVCRYSSTKYQVTYKISNAILPEIYTMYSTPYKSLLSIWSTLSLAVYVTTASNPHESSYACYYDSKLETYLGDCYSVNWMEDVDKVSRNRSQCYSTTFIYYLLEVS